MVTDPRGSRYRLVVRGEIGDRFSSVLDGMQRTDLVPVALAAAVIRPM